MEEVLVKIGHLNGAIVILSVALTIFVLWIIDQKRKARRNRRALQVNLKTTRGWTDEQVVDVINYVRDNFINCDNGEVWKHVDYMSFKSMTTEELLRRYKIEKLKNGRAGK